MFAVDNEHIAILGVLSVFSIQCPVSRCSCVCPGDYVLPTSMMVFLFCVSQFSYGFVGSLNGQIMFAFNC